MRRIFVCTLLFWSVFTFAQDTNSLYLKGNLLLAPVGILNAGVEYQLNSKYTLQGDVLISPWKSFAGYHAQIYMGTIEGRYYFKEAFKKWYVGANFGSSVYDLTKIINDPNKISYIELERYQKGFNFTLGGTVGYQFEWKEKWNLDVFLGGGFIHAFYHGYENPEGQRYDGADNWNKSGEFLPYRGGIMLSYKLK